MNPKKINLALQGGGAHGAYTWGVLDRLLEEKDLVIEGISGTSAGAMNAAMLVSGYAKGGREGARERLEQFWQRISEAGAFSPMHKTLADRLLTGWNMDLSPAYHWFDLMTRIFSPYELNPFNVNPMRGILDDLLDHEAVQGCGLIKLFITATHVASGQARVFQCHEITPDVLLASACMPFYFQAVDINGESYWDGGYMGNPALYPLIYHCDSRDIVIIHVNPTERPDVPQTAMDILSRINEISFNSSLFREMRAIAFVTKLIDDLGSNAQSMKHMLIHSIDADDVMQGFDAASKMNADWGFLTHLHQIGRERAETWLGSHYGDVGSKSTVDIRAKYL